MLPKEVVAFFKPPETWATLLVWLKPFVAKREIKPDLSSLAKCKASSIDGVALIVPHALLSLGVTGADSDLLQARILIKRKKQVEKK